MTEQYHKWYSHSLGLDVEMLVFGTRGYPVILFPTSQGRYFQNKDEGLIESVRWFVEEGLVKIYCPDSFDWLTWYNKGIHSADRARNYNFYDKMLYEELAPWAMHETGIWKVATAGCSFGGYHAANFAFRYPWLVSHMFSLSGAFDIRGQLDGFYNEEVYYHNPVDYLPGDHNPDLWKMKIVLGTSDRDICRGYNEQLSEILNKKGISHWLDIRPNADHDWPIWREMLPDYLSKL